jgi:serine/threonine-protein kinase
MPFSNPPRSLESLRRRAKALGRQQNIAHGDALDLVAQQYGYANWTHARHELASGSGATPVQPNVDYPERPRGMAQLGRETYLARCREVFGQTTALLTGGASQRVWTDRSEILDVLNRLLAHTRSHTHLPTGGGQTFSEVRLSREPGALEFQVDRGAVYLARPARLTIQRVAQSPGDGFALLELADLAPSGVNDVRDDGPFSRREEVLDLGRGEYRHRSLWDQGFLDYDEEGREVPLPDAARLMVRWFNGKMLFVSNGSRWNGLSATYDGRHDGMSVDEIAAMIDGWLRYAA